MGHSVLLIDDSAILRRIATNILGGPSLRSEVVTATRASEGFARACGAPPDLILVDAGLAGSAKLELCQKLLLEPRTAAVPVVLLLGRGTAAPAMDDVPVNVVETLSKPFTPDQLLACVKAIHKAVKATHGNFASIRECVQGTGGGDVLVDRQMATASVGPASSAARSTAGLNGRNGDLVDAATKPSTTLPALTGTDEPAVLTGNLRTAFLRISTERLSGVLHVAASGQSLLDVYFEAGSVVVVTTEHVADYVHAISGVLPAKVSPATLEAAADEQRASGVPFLLTLGARGLLSKAAAVDLLHRFGQRFFSRVWQLRPAMITARFNPLDALPGFTLRLEPRRESVESWLLGTLRCVKPEDIATTAKHEGFVGTPSFVRGAQALLGALALTDKEAEFASCVDGKLDLPGIAKAIGCTAESAYLLLHRFRALDLMQYRPAPRAFVVTPRTNVRRVLPLRQ